MYSSSSSSFAARRGAPAESSSRESWGESRGDRRRAVRRSVRRDGASSSSRPMARRRGASSSSPRRPERRAEAGASASSPRRPELRRDASSRRPDRVRRGAFDVVDAQPHALRSQFAQHRCVLSRGENGHKAWAHAGGEACAAKSSQKAVDRCFDAYFAGARRAPESGACGELAVGGKVWGSQMLGGSQELRPALSRYLRARRVVVVLLFRVNALDHVPRFRRPACQRCQ